MLRHQLTDEQWELIEDLFPAPGWTGRPPCHRRPIVDGILWILRTGSPWPGFPEVFGPWLTVWRLFDQRSADGTLDAFPDRLHAYAADAGDIDNHLWCIDRTIVRATKCAAGVGEKGSR